MSRILSIAAAPALLVCLPACDISGPGPSDLSDLELEAVTLMSGPGISPSAMQIEQGVRANVSGMVFVNNLARPGGQDTFDRDNVIVDLSLWNTAPDQKDETGGLEEYHARIIYGEGIGWVSKELGPVVSITVTDD
jgi:hypothetical protein